jgi:hypothetical protein
VADIFYLNKRFCGQRFFAVEERAALQWVDIDHRERMMQLSPGVYRLRNCNSTVGYAIPDWMVDVREEVVVGDVVVIEWQGNQYTGKVTYATMDDQYHIIEMTATETGKCMYWKQRHDGGRLVGIVKN